MHLRLHREADLERGLSVGHRPGRSGWRRSPKSERYWTTGLGWDDVAPSLDPAGLAELSRYYRRCASPGAALALMKMNTHVDVRDVLTAIRAPTVVMHRTEDRDAQVEEGRYIAAHISGARFAEFPGADHS